PEHRAQVAVARHRLHHPPQLLALAAEEESLEELADGPERRGGEDGKPELCSAAIAPRGGEQLAWLQKCLLKRLKPSRPEAELSAPLPRCADRFFGVEGAQGGLGRRRGFRHDQRLAADRTILAAWPLRAECIAAARTACEHSAF